MNRRALLIACLVVIPAALGGQVSYERLLKAADDPKNWLTYSGSYASQRHSVLRQIDVANVKNLELKWVHQTLSTWHSPSFSPRTGLFYLTIWENCSGVFVPEDQEYRRGEAYLGGKFDTRTRGFATPGMQGGHIYTGAEETGTGAVIALEPRTGRRRWTFPMTNVSMAGNLTTASDLLFTGSREGHFHALDARTGALLWKASLGADIKGGPITYEVDGKQHVAIAGGHALFVFGLPN